MSLPISTFYRDFYARWIQYVSTDKPINSFFLSGSENISEMRATYQTLGSVEKFTEYLLNKAQEEEAYGGNTGLMNSSCFQIMGE